MSRLPAAPPESLEWLCALRQPVLCTSWTTARWERSIRVARRARLLGRLAEAVDAAGLMDQVPEPVRRHLVAEQRVSRSRTSAMRWAMDRVMVVLADAPYPKILLKGAAYVAQQLPIALGRLPSDLDIMVPKADVDDAQRRLLAAGWTEAQLDAHDRQYYLEWSHEVPPMTHPSLQMELDLHHNILPPVGHVSFDAGLLVARLKPSSVAGWQVLDPVDQVLHSAAHLFFDSSFQNRIRDLVDLDGLLRQFGESPAFWPTLEARSSKLGLEEPLALAVVFVAGWLGTPIPQQSKDLLVHAGLGLVRRIWLVTLFKTVLEPETLDEQPGLARKIAETLLLARYHWRRMPLRILVPHLWHKSVGQRRTGHGEHRQSPMEP